MSSGTSLCGIILHPAGHTLSPVLHRAAYASLGIDAVYVPFDVSPERLRDAFAGKGPLNGGLIVGLFSPPMIRQFDSGGNGRCSSRTGGPSDRSC